METLVFSQNLIQALFVLLFTCMMVPVLFYIWVAFKRKINHWALLAGLVSFFVFGYFLSGFLLGTFAPVSMSEKMGFVGYSISRAFWAAVAEVGGIWVTLLLLSKRFSSIKVPTGIGLGFRLFDLLILGGINAYTRLNLAYTVNKQGLETVLKSVNSGETDQLKIQLDKLAAETPYTFIMSAVDYICLFVITVATARIIWYSIENGTKSRDKEKSPLFLLIGFALRFAAGIPLALYQSGGGSYKPCAAIYYVLTAFITAFAIWLSRNRDANEKVSADSLKPRTRRGR